MTAQTPERIILDGRPRALHAEPLDQLCEHNRLELANPDVHDTANYRGYVGTWEIIDRRLYLVHLCWHGWEEPNWEVPISDELRRKLLRAASSSDFPIHAHWFNGVLRIALGRRLIYSHHGWSHWFERERVIRFQAGEIVRDREVDTRAILERWLRRRRKPVDVLLNPSNSGALGPLTWFDDDDDDTDDDWWPPDYVRAPEQQG